MVVIIACILAIVLACGVSYPAAQNVIDRLIGTTDIRTKLFYQSLFGSLGFGVYSSLLGLPKTVNNLALAPVNGAMITLFSIMIWCSVLLYRRSFARSVS